MSLPPAMKYVTVTVPSFEIATAAGGGNVHVHATKGHLDAVGRESQHLHGHAVGTEGLTGLEIGDVDADHAALADHERPGHGEESPWSPAHPAGR